MTLKEFLKIESVMGKERLVSIFKKELRIYHPLHSYLTEEYQLAYMVGGNVNNEYINFTTIDKKLKEDYICVFYFSDDSISVLKIFNVIKLEYRKYKIDALNI